MKEEIIPFSLRRSFVIFQINYEYMYQIQIRWSLVYRVGDQLILPYFMWIITKGSVKSGAWKISMSFIKVSDLFFRLKFVQTSITWYYESQCTGQDQVFVTYLMSYLEFRGLNCRNYCNSCLLSVKFSCPRTRCG